MVESKNNIKIAKEEIERVHGDVLRYKEMVAERKSISTFYLNNIFFDGPIVEILLSKTNIDTIVVTTSTVWFIDHLYYNKFNSTRFSYDGTITAATQDDEYVYISLIRNNTNYTEIICIGYESMKENPELTKKIDSNKKILSIRCAAHFEAIIFLSEGNEVFIYDKKTKLIHPQFFNISQGESVKSLVVGSKFNYILGLVSNGSLKKIVFSVFKQLDLGEEFYSDIVQIMQDPNSEKIYTLNKNVDIHLFDPINSTFDLVISLKKNYQLENITKFSISHDRVFVGLSNGKIFTHHILHPNVPSNLIYSFSSEKNASCDFLYNTFDGKHLVIATNSNEQPDFRMLKFEGFTYLESIALKSNFNANNITISKNETLYAVSSVDGKIQIYDMATTKLVNEIPNAHKGNIVNIEFSGNKLVSAGSDSCVKIFSPDNFQLLKELPEYHKAPISCMRCNGKLVATLGQDNTLKITSLENYEEIFSIGIENQDVALDIAINFQKDKVATCGRDGLINVYDINNKSLITLNLNERKPIKNISFSCNGKNLIYLTESYVFIVDYEQNKIIKSFLITDLENGLSFLVTREHSTNFYVACKNYARVYDSDSLLEIDRILLAGKQNLVAITISHMNRYLLTIEDQVRYKQIGIYDTFIPKAMLKCKNNHTKKIISICIGSKNQTIYTMDIDGNIMKSNLDSSMLEKSVVVADPKKMYLSPDDNHLFVILQKGLVVDFNTADMKSTEIQLSNEEIIDIDISSDNLSLLVGTNSGKMSIYRTVNWNCSGMYNDMFRDSLNFCCFVTTPQIIAAVGDGTYLKVFNTRQNISLYTTNLDNPDITHIAVTPYSKTSVIVIGFKNKQIRIIDLNNPESNFLHDLEIIPEIISLSSSGSLLALDNKEGERLIYDMMNLRVLKKINYSELKKTALTAMTFSRNSSLVATALDTISEKYVELLEFHNISLPKTIEQEETNINCFYIGKKRAALGTDNGYVKIIDLGTLRDLCFAKDGNSSHIIDVFLTYSEDNVIIVHYDGTVINYNILANKEIGMYQSKNAANIVIKCCLFHAINSKLYLLSDKNDLYFIGLADAQPALNKVATIKFTNNLDAGKVLKRIEDKLFCVSESGCVSCCSLPEGYNFQDYPIGSQLNLEKIIGFSFTQECIYIVTSEEIFVYSMLENIIKYRWYPAIELKTESKISSYHLTPKKKDANNDEKVEILGLGFEDGNIVLLTRHSLTPIKFINQAHTEKINHIYIDEARRFLYSCSDDNSLKRSELNSFDDPLMDLYHTLDTDAVAMTKEIFTFNPYFNICYLSYLLCNENRKSEEIGLIFGKIFTELKDNLCEYITGNCFSIRDFIIWHDVLHTNNLDDMMFDLANALYVDIQQLPITTNQMEYYLNKFSYPTFFVYFTKKYIEIYLQNFFIAMTLNRTTPSKKNEILVDKKVVDKGRQLLYASRLSKFTHSLIRGEVDDMKTKKIISLVYRSRLNIFNDDPSSKDLQNFLNVIGSVENYNLLCNTTLETFIDHYWGAVKIIGNIYVICYAILFATQWILGFTVGLDGNLDTLTIFDYCCLGILVLFSLVYEVYEILDFRKSGLAYFSSTNNVIDQLHILTTLAFVIETIITNIFYYQLYMVMLFIGIIRMFLVLQNIDSIRIFTFRLLKIFYDVRVFFILCGIIWISLVQMYRLYSIVELGDSEGNFFYYVLTVYNYFFANWDNPDEGVFGIFFLLITIVLTIVMMNVLIVQIGESFQESSVVAKGIDNDVKIKMILEYSNAKNQLQSLFCKKKMAKKNAIKAKLYYLYLYITPENADNKLSILESANASAGSDEKEDIINKIKLVEEKAIKILERLNTAKPLEGGGSGKVQVFHKSDTLMNIMKSKKQEKRGAKIEKSLTFIKPHLLKDDEKEEDAKETKEVDIDDESARLIQKPKADEPQPEEPKPKKPGFSFKQLKGIGSKKEGDEEKKE